MQHNIQHIVRLLLYFFSITGTFELPLTQEPCVTLRQGDVCGTNILSRGGRRFSAFRGIPYAKPPVGEYRFADPEPAEPWENVLHATEDAPMCIQKNYLLPNPVVEGQEDCLYLNVYTPYFLTRNTVVKNPFPVMLYIHGGGFFSGTGNSEYHGPEYLLDENIVLVTMNYRLAVMGFLSTGDDASAGNWALKDMTLVLKWIRDNIHEFGGNPQCVTIFGQSAGGASVHYLMLSPKTKGLFHKAISQSGSSLNLWARPLDSLQIAKAQALFVNCSSNLTNKQLVQCLRNVPADVLVESADKFKFWSIDPLTTFLPSVEKKTPANPDPFLPDVPINLIKKGLYHPVPYMIGIMANEGIIRAAPIASQEDLRTDLNSRWDILGPQLFAAAQSVPEEQVSEFWDKISDFYMGKDDFVSDTDSKNIQRFVNFYSDRAFIYGIYQMAKYHVEQNYAPVYFYKIDYAGLYTWADIFSGVNATLDHKFNTSHCDDLIYLFTMPAVFPQLPSKSKDTDLSKQLVKMWTNFATYSKPAKFWEPLQIENYTGNNTRFRYLNIGGPNKMIMNSKFLTRRMQFWTNLDILENK